MFVQVHVVVNSWAQLCGFPPATLTLGELHVAGIDPVEQVIVALLVHRLWACVIVATFWMPPPKIVSSTSAATSITTAVTTISMVVDSPFMHIIWAQRFKNPSDFPCREEASLPGRTINIREGNI